jgi:hypothetical protein
MGNDGLLLEAHKSLVAAAIGACSCGTKTPESDYHTADCRYLKIMSALECIEYVLQPEERA